MLDSAQRRAELIKHLLAAQALADELLDGDTMHLIEHALAQADKTVELEARPQTDAA